MRSVRANLRAVVAAMLLGQLAGFALLPAALCCTRETSGSGIQVSAHERKPCCPGMAPGQVCPMHRAESQKQQNGPRLRCAPDSGSPLALIGLLGILSAPPTADADVAPAGVVSISAFDRPTGEITVHSPPPRA
jgi:hypothetical protein